MAKYDGGRNMCVGREKTIRSAKDITYIHEQSIVMRCEGFEDRRPEYGSPVFLRVRLSL
jgi:hypothetical protein